MGRFVKGEIIVTPFPFSDLKSSIKRPALILTTLKGDDVMPAVNLIVERI